MKIGGLGRKITFQELEKLYIEIWNEIILSEHDFQPVEMSINTRLKKTLGYARYKFGKPSKVEFTPYILTGKLDYNTVVDVVRHEVLHHRILLDGHKNEHHGKIWKEYCKKFNVDSGHEKLQIANNWTEPVVACGKCGNIVYNVELDENLEKYINSYICHKCKIKFDTFYILSNSLVRKSLIDKIGINL